jgi:hypothetical protein
VAAIAAGRDPLGIGHARVATGPARGTPMLERTAIYAYFVLLAISLLLEQSIPLAVAP